MIENRKGCFIVNKSEKNGKRLDLSIKTKALDIELTFDKNPKINTPLKIRAFPEKYI